jgi:hypothetical protein
VLLEDFRAVLGNLLEPGCAWQVRERVRLEVESYY